MDDLLDQIESKLVPHRFMRCGTWAALSLLRSDGGFLSVVVVGAKPERVLRWVGRDVVMPATVTRIFVGRKPFQLSELDAALKLIAQR